MQGQALAGIQENMMPWIPASAHTRKPKRGILNIVESISLIILIGKVMFNSFYVEAVSLTMIFSGRS